jgi:hypothetical protein
MEYFSLKGIAFHLYFPLGTTHSVLYLSFGVMPIFQNPLFKSNLLKILQLAILANNIYLEGSGYLIGISTSFRGLKFITILGFPLFCSECLLT